MAYSTSNTGTTNITQESYEKLAQDLILCKTNIAGYFFDGFLEVNHTLNSTVTQHQVQQGVTVSDHAYVEPAEVTMTIKMSDAMSTMFDFQFEGLSYTRSTAAYKILRELLRNRTPFQIHTRLVTYQNMMITGLSVNDDLENLYGLECTVTMKELLVADEKKVKISSRTNTTATTNLGTISASSLSNDSILYSLFGSSS